MFFYGTTDIGKKRVVNQDNFKIKEYSPEVTLAVVCDGKIIEETLAESRLDADKINKLILSSKIPIENIMIMTVDKNGISYIAERDRKK